MGGNESSGREHANITLAMRWTQRERQTKEEVGSQVLYAARGGGSPTRETFLGCRMRMALRRAAAPSQQIWRWAGGRQNVIITPRRRRDEDAETSVALSALPRLLPAEGTSSRTSVSSSRREEKRARYRSLTPRLESS